MFIKNITNLGEYHKNFLEHHKISASLVFDATGTGLVGKNLKEAMYNSDTIFAVGTNNCNAGHDIKTRSGHCPVCNTERIAHMLRSIEKEAYIYVVGSMKGQVLKVGFTKDYNDRLSHLNKDTYGGFNDWEFLYYAKYKKAGIVEIELHQKLDKYNFLLTYNRSGKNIKCYELFKCPYLYIKQLLYEYNEKIGIQNVKNLFELQDAEVQYNFTEIEKTEKRKGEEHGTINKINNYNIETNQENKMVNDNKFYDLCTGRIIDNVSENIVFDSEIEIQNNIYGIFNLENEYGIANIETGEIIGETFEECGKIIELDGKFYLNVKKDNNWKIIDIFTNKSLYGDFDYIYQIEPDGFVKVKKNGKWKIIDVEDGKVEDCKLFAFFELIEIDDKKYIQVIDGIVDLDNEEYVGGTFDRVSHIQKIGDEYYFGVFKDINEEESLSGLVSFKEKKLIGEWYDSFDYDFDKWDGDNESLFINFYNIGGETCIIFINQDEKYGVLNLKSGKQIGRVFDRILDVKEFNFKTYIIFEEDIETGIYNIKDDRIIEQLFYEVVDYYEINDNVFIKIKYQDDLGYIDLNNEKLLGDFYEEVSDITNKNNILYFSFSDYGNGYGLYDVTNNKILNNTDLYEIKESSIEEYNGIGLKITSGFDKSGNTKTVDGKQYMPVLIGSREGIYCHNDKIIIGDLYEQLGYIKESYGEYKDCDISEHEGNYYFVVKKGWKFGYVNLKTGEFQDRGLFLNILSLLGL